MNIVPHCFSSSSANSGMRMIFFCYWWALYCKKCPAFITRILSARAFPMLWNTQLSPEFSRCVQLAVVTVEHADRLSRAHTVITKHSFSMPWTCDII